MAGIVEKISLVQRFLKALTWNKIAQLFVFLLLVGVSVALYETREYLHEFTKYPRISQYSTPVYSLSNDTKAEIDSMVARSDLIVGIVITTVDFNRNARHILYRSTDNPGLRDIYNNNRASVSAELPLFNDDTINNARMVDLINGEFVCHPYANSIDAIVNPATIPFAHTVCSNGIPPFYGMFSGTVNIITVKAPSPAETSQIREVIRNLALKIYERDFK